MLVVESEFHPEAFSLILQCILSVYTKLEQTPYDLEQIALSNCKRPVGIPARFEQCISFKNSESQCHYIHMTNVSIVYHYHHHRFASM